LQVPEEGGKVTAIHVSSWLFTFKLNSTFEEELKEQQEQHRTLHRRRTTRDGYFCFCVYFFTFFKGGRNEKSEIFHEGRGKGG